MAQLKLRNYLYVPDHLVQNEVLEQFQYKWTTYVYEDVVDERGNVIHNKSGSPKTKRRKEQHSLRTYQEVLLGEWADHIALPRGDRTKIQSILREHDVIDERPIWPLPIPLRPLPHVLQDERWPDQWRCIQAWLEQGTGIITGGTGTGKTVIGAGAICALRLRTLILSTLRDGHAHWEKEIRALTNINEIEERLGRRLLGPINIKKKIFYPITTSTVQSYLHEGGGKEAIKHLQDKFSLIVSDEVHELASEEHSKILGNWNPLLHLGLTATIERVDDKRHFLLYDVIGPVAAEGKKKEVDRTVVFISTGVSQPSWLFQKAWPPRYRWRKSLDYYCTSEKRLSVILKYVRQDIDNGKLVAVVSEERTAIPRHIYNELKSEGYDVAYADGKTRNRDRIYEDFNAGKYRCLCAGKILRALVNIGNLNCLHVTTPLNKRKTILQAYGRTRTYATFIRHYVDGGPQMMGAFKNSMKYAREEGWRIKRIDAVTAQMEGMSLWKKSKRPKK